MSELRIAEFLETVEVPGSATFFCTQRYPSLEKTHHELGPHPHLAAGIDWDAELRRMRALFPDARGWRSHSCVFSHLLAEWLSTNGYQYVSTFDQFAQVGIRPVRHPWGVWHVPIYYMDNMDFSLSNFWAESEHKAFSDDLIERTRTGDGIYVFDFHPIHLLLNTPNREYYFDVRDRFKAGEKLSAIAHKGEGTRHFFERLCTALSRDGTNSVNLGRALEAHLQGIAS